MSSFFEIVILCIGMFVVTTAIGMSVFCFRDSERIKDPLLIYGAGIMIGAAFSVIIPEGVMALISFYTDIHMHELEGILGSAMASGFALMLICDELRHQFKKDAVYDEMQESLMPTIQSSEILDPSDILVDPRYNDM